MGNRPSAIPEVDAMSDDAILIGTRGEQKQMNGCLRRAPWIAAVLGCIMTLAAWPVVAEEYPARPLRIIVPYAPGGPTDIVARIVGERLSEQLGQPVVVDNRPGAGGSIGTGLVAKSTPDGYTLLLCSSGPMAVSPALGQKLPYDPRSDIAPVSLVVTIPYLLLTHTSGPASVKELIAQARANPGKLNYGSAGLATTSYFAAALFASQAHIELVHVPYKGSSQAAAELAGGHLTMLFEAVPAALRIVKTGKVRILGVSTLERFPLLPDVPTIQESGVPGYEASTWSGICTTAGAPEGAIERVGGAIVQALKDPAITERFAGLGARAVGNTPRQFGDFIRKEQAKWVELVKAIGTSAR
jgi:tripartite-type tricarboxylate transporter receptor subunit TctC